MISFQNYIDQYPHSASIPEAIYWIGQSHYNQGAYKEAIGFFERVEANYPAHDKVPNALLKEAFSYIELGQPDRAKEILSRLIERFPQSNEAYRARDTLSTLSQ
jgi:tol-pal system protein YbgF